MALISCPNCGEKISDTSTQCQFCGTVLSEKEVVIDTTQATTQTTENTTNPIPKQPHKEPSENEKQFLQWQKEIEENRKGLFKFLAKFQSAPRSKKKFVLVYIFGTLLTGIGGFIPVLTNITSPMIFLSLTLGFIGALLFFIPTTIDVIYKGKEHTTALEIYLYTKKQKIDLQENVKHCLLNWDNKHKIIIRAWCYQKKSSNFIGNVISFCIDLMVNYLSLLFSPLFFTGMLSPFLGMSFLGQWITIDGNVSILYTLCIFAGIVLILACIFRLIEKFFIVLEEHEIFRQLKKHLLQEYSKSKAIEVYGIPTDKETITVNETVSYTDENGETKTKVECKKLEVRNPNIKNKWIALILCFFFGMFGAHLFYSRKYGTAVFYILTLGGLVIGRFIDLLRLIISVISKPSPYYDIQKTN